MKSKGRKRKLTDKTVIEGLAVTPELGIKYGRAAGFTEKIVNNPDAFNTLKKMEDKVDEKVYKKVLMNPNFIVNFIDVYNKKRSNAIDLLIYALREYKKVDSSKMNDVAGDLQGRLGFLHKKRTKRLKGRQLEKHLDYLRKKHTIKKEDKKGK